MEKIIEVINFIKENINTLNYDEMKNNMKRILQKEISSNFFKEEDLDFMLDLILDNTELNTDTLKEIILNFKKKIEYKVLLSNESNSELNKSYTKYNINVFTNILNIFSDFGYIFIHPEKLVVLWNEKDLKNSENSVFVYNKKTNQTLIKYSDTEKLNKETEYIIKYVNYDLILNTNNFKNYPVDVFDNFDRKIGLFSDKNGFMSKYQLNVYNNQTSIHDFFYKGLITVFLNKNKKTFFLKDNNTIENMLKYYRKDIIKLFKKNKFYGLKLQYFFLKNDFLKDYIDLILKIFEYDNPRLYPLEEEKKIIEIIINDNKENVYYEIQDKCPHEKIVNNFFQDQENYFKNIEKFMEENINYENDLAICKICNEVIVNLNIHELNEYDSNKYIGYINNILDYPPYNSIFNLKYYFENFFFLFNNYTKISFINNTEYITKISVDNFIHISSNRLELEYKYRQNILNNDIFFIRFANNFFEIDLEKEKFTEKKTVFSYFLIIMVLCSFLTIKDYNHLIFIKKVINLKKLKNDEINFDNIITLFIIFLFKNLNITYYNENKNKFERINTTIKIYKEIVNDELKTIYNNKAKLIENFIVNKQNIDYNIYIAYSKDIRSPYTDLNEDGQYILDLENVFSTQQYISKYNFFSLYNNTHYKQNNIIELKQEKDDIFVDFNELNSFEIESKYEKDLYIKITEAFYKIKYFLYENKTCIVKSLSEQKIIRKKNIEKNDVNYISSVGINIQDITENINKNTINYITDKEEIFIEERNKEILSKNESDDEQDIETITIEDIGGSNNSNNPIEEFIDDENYILIFNNKSVFKNFIELDNLIPVTDSSELKFFLNGDKYVFKKQINKSMFLEIIENFILFVKQYFNINFYSNFYNYFENNYINVYDKNFLIKIKLFIIIILIKNNKIKKDFIHEYKTELEKKT